MWKRDYMPMFEEIADEAVEDDEDDDADEDKGELG